MSTTAVNTKPVRIVALVAIIAGILLIVAGGVTWGVVRSQLVAENITIPDDAMAFQGTTVSGPLGAFVQADIINTHALEATGGQTYAELDREDPLRAVVQTGSFLRASLFTSVIAFGIAAFAAGMGVLFILVGWALRSLVPVEAKVEAAV
ncbi:aromatic ring-opening dioxygenase LigA [Actinotalea sp.]|uniref:aromatic ring-opening dioxygenase LigA n=1 Tax=Actinotalea sp. TaxID=1872145 RepID=UPI002BE8745D|nr:aromatic ring-opening dioxygenase LigA [Actinotalea sp.]HQY33934.1 aromatic ring-opening dioxygenase LigA [Actinotalea sp.]HRA50590.1 aromatic ring-opening dioxygenase LigA [Actinotalea sp.]